MSIYHSSLFGDIYFRDPMGIDRSRWNSASKTALERFESAKKSFENYMNDLNITKNDWALVNLPNNHLTDYCWKQFREFVERNGYKARRRTASKEEKDSYKETRKGKVYFIDCKFASEANTKSASNVTATSEKKKEKKTSSTARDSTTSTVTLGDDLDSLDVSYLSSSWILVILDPTHFFQ